MVERYAPDALVSFPCHYEFKVFGPAADVVFAETVHRAVNRVVPVGRAALRAKFSSGGRYQCITVPVRLENRAQLTGIYAILRGIDGLRYLL